MEAILGTLSGDNNKLLLCGNPTRTSGIFYDSHNRDRESYKTHKVSSLDSPRTSKENIEMLKKKYGEGSDLWKVRVLGEFPSGEMDTFMSLEIVEFAAQEVKTEPIGTTLRIGVDVARFGEDSTEMYAGMGYSVVGHEVYNKQDTMATTGAIIRLAKEMLEAYPNIEHVEIRVDDSGVGGGVTDRLNEIMIEENLTWTIVPINNGASSLDEHYGNLGAEMWGSIKAMLEQNMTNFINGDPGVLQLPDDDVLISQFSTRKWHMSSKGKILLERKEDMKKPKRGLKSPDRADAFVLCFGDFIIEPDETGIMPPMIGSAVIKR
jgi:hypothetical protein